MICNRNTSRLIKLFLVLCVFCACFSFVAPVQAAETVKGNTIEISDYDLKYSFSVPKEYEDKIYKLTDARVNVQFTDTVYMSLAVNEYFKTLSDEEIGEHEISDYTIGNEIFDETYNDQEYMTAYFVNKLTSMSGNQEIQSTELQTIHRHDFWVCRYTLYKESMNYETGETEKTETGEGRIYFNMTDGIVYYILLNSSDGALALQPDAVNTVESFAIGKKIKPILFLVWGIIAALIVGCIMLFRNWISAVPQENTHDTRADGQTMVLNHLRKFIPSKTDSYRKAKKISTDEEEITRVVPVTETTKDTFDTDHVMAQINELKKELELRNTQYSEETASLTQKPENDSPQKAEEELPHNYFLEHFDGIKNFFRKLYNKIHPKKIPPDCKNPSSKQAEPQKNGPNENYTDNQKILDALDQILDRK